MGVTPGNDQPLPAADPQPSSAGQASRPPKGALRAAASAAAGAVAEFWKGLVKAASGSAMLMVLAVVLVGACRMTGAGYPAKTTSLRMRGNVADAQVSIDDIPLGSLAYVAQHGVALPPGRHRITVEKVGYFPWDAVVEAENQLIQLQVAMVPIPD